MISLFDSPHQKNVMFADMSSGEAIQANQHLIIINNEGMLLDPGGHKIFPTLFAKSSSLLPLSGLKYLFLSHQDPDIVAALNGWLMTTDAMAFAPSLWMRFIPHFGIDSYVIDRLTPIPDEGMCVELGGQELKFIPAHFLHSSGNYQVYDPASKILYTGDLGASVGQSYDFVEDFDDHIQYMAGFHRRYMASTKALKMWANTARQLDIDIIAPQHGSIFATKELSTRFIDWIDSIECGLDVMGDSFPIP